MPETYWNEPEMIYVYNDWDNEGALKLIKNKKDFQLFDTIEKIELSEYERHLKPIDPFMVIRSRNSYIDNTIKVERYQKAQEYLEKYSGDGLIQRYIRCKGKNRELNKMYTKPKMKSIIENEKQKQNENNDDSLKRQNYESSLTEETNTQFNLTKTQQQQQQKNVEQERKKTYSKPTVVRLEYKTRFNRQKGGNVAYCLTNKDFVEPSIQAGTKEILEKYSFLTTLNTAKSDSFLIYIMSGESVAPYEFYANQLVAYIQKWFKLLLESIVVDFMKDERGIIYFLGVKSFTAVKYTTTVQKALSPIANEEDNIKKFYKTWTCRLCLLPYPKNKITKIVTFKLLYKLKENLKKRGCHYFDHINSTIYNESESCRVCDLCYTLLVTEQELMEIQKTIALCNNIEIQNEELLNNESKTPEGLVRAPQMFNQLTQWRIMFYFLKFFFFDFSKFPFENGSQLPVNATPREKKRGKTNYKLYITLFNQKISIPIFTEMKQFISNDEVNINATKIFYFFTSETSSIKQILRNEEVDFRIVLNEKWNDPLASCKTTCFSCYEDNIKEKPMISRTVLNFFSDYVKHFKCQVQIGLKNDGLVQTENLQMYCYKLPNPIYITDLDYYSYHSMPNDWYELYVPPGTKIEDDTNYEIDKMIDNIIDSLKGKEKKKRESNDDEVYDPYEQLVQVQNKNNIINKIQSIPIVLDKEFIDMKQEQKKERPCSSLLRLKFCKAKNKEENTIPKKKRIDVKKYMYMTPCEIQKQKELEKEEEKKIKGMDDKELKELISEKDKQLEELSNMD